MVYVYVCDACRRGAHERCEDEQGTPAEKHDLSSEELSGGGICVCTHVREQERSAYEQAVWSK